MRRFVVIGQEATTSPDFSLTDLPASSGRLDILLRCLRAALLVSHGIRPDVVAYLVLLGGPLPPRVLRIEGKTVRFLRPDERSLAMLVKKALARAAPGPSFTPIREGLAIAPGGLDVVLADLGRATPYVLEEGGLDVRAAPLELTDPVFFVGDHRGLDPATRARLAAIGASPRAVGPVSVHADDAVALVSNEMDRREAAIAPAAPT